MFDLIINFGTTILPLDHTLTLTLTLTLTHTHTHTHTYIYIYTQNCCL